MAKRSRLKLESKESKESKALKKLRLFSGFSQREMARRLGDIVGMLIQIKSR